MAAAQTTPAAYCLSISPTCEVLNVEPVGMDYNLAQGNSEMLFLVKMCKSGSFQTRTIYLPMNGSSGVYVLGISGQHSNLSGPNGTLSNDLNAGGNYNALNLAGVPCNDW